jgi:hypothetical protein
MAQPFVISVNFVEDASTAASAADQTVRSIDRVSQQAAPVLTAGPQASTATSSGFATARRLSGRPKSTSPRSVRSSMPCGPSSTAVRGREAARRRPGGKRRGPKPGKNDATETATAIAAENAAYEKNTSVLTGNSVALAHLSGESRRPSMRFAAS